MDELVICVNCLNQINFDEYTLDDVLYLLTRHQVKRRERRMIRDFIRMVYEVQGIITACRMTLLLTRSERIFLEGLEDDELNYTIRT